MSTFETVGTTCEGLSRGLGTKGLKVAKKTRLVRGSSIKVKRKESG